VTSSNFAIVEQNILLLL